MANNRILTCTHHQNLRWSTKPEGWSGFYNQQRNIFFKGAAPFKAHEDKSGLIGVPATECACPPKDLILAPEDDSNHPIWNTHT